MRRYVPELMPLIVEALSDGPAATKREVGVATLGQLVQSTGYAIDSGESFWMFNMVLFIK